MIPVCPKCDVSLFIAHYRSVEVDYCDRCRGVWLDAGELAALAGHDPLAASLYQTGVVPPGKKHLCPRCDTPLEEITTAGPITLDRCPGGHGLWFDADELQQLIAQANAGVLNEVFTQQPTP